MTALAKREDHALRVVAAFTRIADRASPVALEFFEDWLHCCATFDENHPASLGCLLALVREVWGPTCSVVHVLGGGGWALITSGGALGLPELGKGYPTRFHPTYAEGLVAALESAP